MNPQRLLPYLSLSTMIFMALGLVYGLLLSPPNPKYGDIIRILYLHIPSVWLSIILFAVCGIAGALVITTKHQGAKNLMRAALPIGIVTTLVSIVSGMFWSKAIWNEWWLWDGRMTSLSILFFLYVACIAIRDAFTNTQHGNTAAACLALIGLLNFPLIKYVMQWWNNANQFFPESSLEWVFMPNMTHDTLLPLIFMALGLIFFLSITLIINTECEERHGL